MSLMKRRIHGARTVNPVNLLQICLKISTFGTDWGAQCIRHLAILDGFTSTCPDSCGWSSRPPKSLFKAILIIIFAVMVENRKYLTISAARL